MDQHLAKLELSRVIEQCLVDVYPYLYLLVGVRQGGRVDLHAPGQAASYYPTLPIWTVIHLRLASASASAAIGSSQDHIYSSGYRTFGWPGVESRPTTVGTSRSGRWARLGSRSYDDGGRSCG